MPPLKEVSTSRSPEDCLRAALRAATPEARAEHAREGLADPSTLEPDTHVLLLRQIYLSHLEAHRFRAAAQVAMQMAGLGPLADVARQDAARALMAMGDREAAIAQQRMAARAAPPERRSFQWWSLGTLLHFAGDHEGAVLALRRGERWAHVDRPLLRAHRAWVRLEAGQPVRNLGEIIASLEASRKASGGYGQLVLGMLRYLMGDSRRAVVHLRAWLRRMAGVDEAKAITLREELRRARTVLAELESD